MKTHALIFALAGCVLLCSCGSARRSEPLVGPWTAANEQIARGHRLFDIHCDACHTVGESALGPALNNKPLPGFMLRLQIRRGLGAMPSFDESELSDEELEDVVAYVQALRKHGR